MLSDENIWLTIDQLTIKEKEISILKLIVEQFLAYTEIQATSHKPMYMKDWIEKLQQSAISIGKGLLILVLQL